MNNDDLLDYEELSQSFNQALLHTLRKHTIADTILDYWVPEADPLQGVVGMIDSARIAGHAEISVRFRFESVSEERVPELREAIEAFATVTLDAEDGGMIVRATAMSRADDETPAESRENDGGKPKYWSAEMAPPANEGPVVSWDQSADSPDEEFADVHPTLRPALKETDAAAVQQDIAPTPADGLVRIESREGTVTLALDIDPESHLVRAAGYEGAASPATRILLGLFCRAATDLPVQEVADHVALEVLETLVDDEKTPPVPGILLPANAGAAFTLAPRLARDAYTSYCRDHGLASDTNFYYAPPGSGWLSLSHEEQDERIERELSAFLQSSEQYPDDMELLRMEANKFGYRVRGVIEIADRIDVNAKPALMRDLERHLRNRVEKKIELVADRATDKSPLRRLS
jgi:hypothetical protein